MVQTLYEQMIAEEKCKGVFESLAKPKKKK